jgi:acyl-coenzyme A synthetase/AMP-(fatty) acid ligase
MPAILFRSSPYRTRRRFAWALYAAAHDLTSLRVIVCAGEPLNPEAWRWAQTHRDGDGKWGYVIDNWWAFQ